MEDNSTSPPTPPGPPAGFVSSRHSDATPQPPAREPPRLGRRESEPHSAEITYLHDVLATNFPQGRVVWDLHHYFWRAGEKLDIQFDISFFPDLQIAHTLSSYKAERFGNALPALAINVLSKSTWVNDVGLHVDECRTIGIPVYVIFPAYHVATRLYQPPFLRAYVLQASGDYHVHELREVTLVEGGDPDMDRVIDVGDAVPFRLGLMELGTPHEGGKKRYRMVLVDPDTGGLLSTALERAQSLLHDETAQAEQAKAQAKQAKAQAKQAKAQAEQIRQELNQYKQKFGELD